MQICFQWKNNFYPFEVPGFTYVQANVRISVAKRFIYLCKMEIYFICKTCCTISQSFSTKCLFHFPNFIFTFSNNTNVEIVVLQGLT
jgi:hypothetical protein